MFVPLELNAQTFALLTQCSTTEPQEHSRIELLNKLLFWGPNCVTFWYTLTAEANSLAYSLTASNTSQTNVG